MRKKTKWDHSSPHNIPSEAPNRVVNRALNVIHNHSYTFEQFESLSRAERFRCSGWGKACEAWLDDNRTVPKTDKQMERDIERERLNTIIYEIEVTMANLDAAVESIKRVMADVQSWSNKKEKE